MRFRLGVVVGFAAGYYLGAKAGRERYVQLEEWLDRVRDTASYQDARTKVLDGWREGSSYARKVIDELSDPDGADRDGDGDPYDQDAPYAEDLEGERPRPRPIRDLFGDPTLN